MNWIFAAEIIYTILVILVCLRIIYDTRSNTKTLAYLLLVVAVPFLGAIIYFSFGINYRKRKLYSKKIIQNEDLIIKTRQNINSYSTKAWENGEKDIQKNKELSRLLLKDNISPVTGNNKLKVLVNGEEKFKEVVRALEHAKHHIHIEYYIFEDDNIGNKIKDILIRKSAEGVKVRFIYDDFGSRSIRKRLVPQLREAGIEAFPFHEIIFLAFANRLNYRNHRKIIIIDGCIGFVGGINIDDRYINSNGNPEQLFWRDTHLRIDGPGTYYLQYLFLCDWNFCAKQNLQPDRSFFCVDEQVSGNKLVQIAASGPDSDQPSILFSLIQAINLAEKEILITTPYFIPGESMLDAITVAALSGISIKILVPGVSDSAFINAAARSYYDDLLKVGVEIYLYKKGFVHAKTMVTDSNVSVIGSANMDYRSFELNFEANAVIYDGETAQQMRDIFYNDIKDAVKIDAVKWDMRPTYKQLFEKIARLISPLL